LAVCVGGCGGGTDGTDGVEIIPVLSPLKNNSRFAWICTKKGRNALVLHRWILKIQRKLAMILSDFGKRTQFSGITKKCNLKWNSTIIMIQTL
jgi:hypothetical protein